tara:strand:+ start:6387 stop:6524 length:138 start_codon:yes stop_codon:yes gene_type:complete
VVQAQHAIERAFAAPGVVDDLIRYDDVTDNEIVGDGANGIHPDDG